MFEEKYLRETIRNFPYKQCPLLQQLVRLIAPIELVCKKKFINFLHFARFFSFLKGQNPSTLTVLTNTLNGRTFEEDTSNHCDACSQPNAPRRCTACKSVCQNKQSRIFFSFFLIRFIIATNYVNEHVGRLINVFVRH